ncbi:MAG: ABC transporter ATP-binding protein [Planctomycetes bacterium]|nr:ABC transporter ATP-binding protein [Planctomycetota bacterium]
MAEALELEQVNCRRGAFALGPIDLALQPGEHLAVLGPSGSGKSTLLDAIAGLTPISGRLRIGGTRADNLPPHRRGVALMLQNLGLWDRLGALENVRLAARDPAAAGAYLDRVSFAVRRDAPVAGLSGGERQRAAIARTLAAQGALTMLDEPGSFLDRASALELADVIRSELRARRGALIVAGHRLDELLRYEPGRLVVMRAGRIVQCDKPEVIIGAPRDRYVGSLLGYEVFLPAVGAGGRLQSELAATEGKPGSPARMLHAWKFGGVHLQSQGIGAVVTDLLWTESGLAARVRTAGNAMLLVPATAGLEAGAAVKLGCALPMTVEE